MDTEFELGRQKAKTKSIITKNILVLIFFLILFFQSICFRLQNTVFFFDLSHA